MANSGFSSLGTWMKAVFVVSLALNLLVLGAVATAWHRHGGKHGKHGSGPGIERSLMRFAHHELSRDKRRELRQSWRAARKTLRPKFEQLREARQAVGRALQADAFDRAEIAKVLGVVSEKRQAVREDVREVFLNLIQTLSPEERRAYGKFLEHHKSRRWGKRHKKRD